MHEPDGEQRRRHNGDQHAGDRSPGRDESDPEHRQAEQLRARHAERAQRILLHPFEEDLSCEQLGEDRKDGEQREAAEQKKTDRLEHGRSTNRCGLFACRYGRIEV